MSIGMLGKFSPDAPLVILSFLLSDLQDYLKVTNTMNEDQRVQTINLILDDYECRNLKPEDYKVIFEGIKKAEYGTAYNRLDGQTIFGAIRAYIERRAAWVEENSYREHNQIRSQENSNLIPEKMKEYYRELLKTVKVAEIEKLEATKPEEPKRPVREKSPKDILIQKLFAEFSEKTKYTEGKPFLELDGEMLDQVEWVEKMLARALEQNKD